MIAPQACPEVLYLSLRTGLPVERPAHDGWTTGDVRQWESEHVAYRVGITDREREEVAAKALALAAGVVRDTLEQMDPIHEAGGMELLRIILGAIEDLEATP